MEFISFLHLEKQFQLRFHGSATPRNNGIVLFTNLEAGSVSGTHREQPIFGLPDIPKRVENILQS